MSRFFRLALGAMIALSVVAALIVGCSDDEQEQPQQQAAQQQQDESSASARTSAAQGQQQQDEPQADYGEPLNIVVSTQVIADWVRQIGGDRVSVRALVPAGADAHTIELTVDDIRAIADADLVIVNGGGLEASYADAILENADSLLDLAETIEAEGYELHPFEGMMSLDDEHDQQEHQQDDHDQQDQQHQQDHEQHDQDQQQEHQQDDHDQQDQQHQQDHEQHDQDQQQEHQQDDHDQQDQQHQQDHEQHDQDEQQEHQQDRDEDQQQHQQDHEQDDHDQQQHQDEQADAHDHGGEDPHFWFDTDLAQAAIEAIAASLIELIPAAENEISGRLEMYLEEVQKADAEVKSLLADLPEVQRLLVTFHDAFGYFARSYDLQVAGFVVEGPEQGVSAEALTELIELIEHEGVLTVFHEPQFDSTILDTIASETNAGRGIIWSQPTDDNPTYIGILVGNARAIAEQ